MLRGNLEGHPRDVSRGFSGVIPVVIYMVFEHYLNNLNEYLNASPNLVQSGELKLDSSWTGLNLLDYAI